MKYSQKITKNCLSNGDPVLGPKMVILKTIYMARIGK
jgi:hypothetical protein